MAPSHRMRRLFTRLSFSQFFSHWQSAAFMLVLLLAALFFALSKSGIVSAASTTVFTDDFSANTSTTWTTSGAIGASSFSVTRSGDDWGARRNTSPAQLELTNDASATTNGNGWIYASTATGSFSSPYTTTLSSNVATVTWNFNMRQIRTDPAGFSGTSYGVAFILGSTSTTPQTAGNGYAVVLGQSGSTDPVRLASFTGGLQGTLTNIITSNTTGLTDFGTDYLSVRVTYTPSTNTWELFLRNDGASAFMAPTTGSLTSQGTAVNNTHTGTALTSMGAYWQGSTTANQTAFFDNVSVVVDMPVPNLSITDVEMTEGNAGTKTYRFTVNLTIPAPTGGVTFDIATADNSATQPGDYTQKTLTSQTIPAGSSSYTFDVLVNGDTTVEPTETFFVNVTNVVGANIGDGQGQGTITNDDSPNLLINDPSITEGNSGTKLLKFTISSTSPAPMSAGFDGFILKVSTMDDTATDANNDYEPLVNQEVTISPGDSSTMVSVTINGDTTLEANETFKLIVSKSDPADMSFSIADDTGVGTIENDDFTLIHDIQGSTETPNFTGTSRQICGIVVGDYQTSAGLSGFFVEEEQSDWDSDTNTSEGIFIFDGATPAVDVNVGDKVIVTGTVLNFGGPPGLTELTSPTVVVNSTGNPLPPAQTVTLPVPTSAATDLEKFEGMRVTFSTLTVTDNADLGRFGELSLATSKLFIPTNSIDPNDNPATGNTTSGAGNVAAVTAQQSLNTRSKIILNDGRSGSNPNPTPFIGAGTNSTIRLGDTVSGLTGVMNYGFGSYRVEPTATVSFTTVNPRPAAPSSVGSPTLKVASYNVENYFIGPPDPTGRGPNNATELTRKRDKVVATLIGLNADVIGLIELEKAGGAAAAQDIVDSLNTKGIGTYAVIADPSTLVGTDTEIKSGIIYRTSTVSPIGSAMTDTAAAAGTYSRDPITQLFQQTSNGARFFFVVNHLRSKACPGSGGDADMNDGQSCFNDRRRNQTTALNTYVNNVLKPIDADVLMVGDYNAYTQEDPLDVLRAAGWTDVIGEGGSEYSFLFDMQVGRLDHAFATSSLAPNVTGATIWHINADEPAVFDYNTENKPDDRYAATPYRSADHDPVLIGLNLPAPPTLSINSVSISEGLTGQTNLNFTVTLLASTTSDIKVNYATVDGTAIAGSDFATTSGMLTFPANTTTLMQQISVPINGDCVIEGNEIFTVMLSNPINATILTGAGMGTINNDDLPGSFQLSSATYSVNENDGTATITVTRTGGTGDNVAVQYATSNGSATAGDYTATSGTLTFACSETSKTFSIPITNDGDDEPNETINLTLNNPTLGATLGTPATAVLTIVDDDVPQLAITNFMLNEGNSGSTNATFDVSLSIPSFQTVTVSYATANSSATAGSDYTAVPATMLTFNPGDTLKTISVPVSGDTQFEIDEIFFVNLSGASNATLLDSQGEGLIKNDDAAPTLSINDVTLNEGNAGTTSFTFNVTLTGAAGFPNNITVDVVSSNGTAMAGSDYNALALTTLTFAGPIASNTVVRTVTVQVNGDTTSEADETFFVTLSNASVATISRAQGTGMIRDDDFAAQNRVSISDPLVCIGDSNTATVHAEVVNPNNAPGNFTFRATFSPQLSGIANTCVITGGTCTVNAGEVVASGPIAANQTISIDYKVRIAPNTPQGTNLCVNSTITLNGNLNANIQACTVLNCPVVNAPMNAAVSAQKAGSVLVFPYYTSKSADRKDTRFAISNIGQQAANVHIFFLEGASCTPADQFICLTPNASVFFKASEYAPEETGWLLAVAVNAEGLPIRNNSLIGNAFVQDGDYIGNYGAEAFAANSPALAAIEGGTATLFFDGSSYDAVASQLAAEIQSPVDSAGQRIVTVGMSGDLTRSFLRGAAQVGAGIVVNERERPFGSFSVFLQGNCQAIAAINNSAPRVPNGMAQTIPSGQTGHMKFNITGGVGLIMTSRTGAWKGIRALHKTGLTPTSITIPVFRPVC